MPADIICPKCQYVGKPTKKKRGSGKIELVGWLCFPLGLPYTLWRMLSKYPVCRNCGNPMLIDSRSRVGQRILFETRRKFGEDEASEPLPPSMPAAPAPVAAAPVKERSPRPPADPDKW